MYDIGHKTKVACVVSFMKSWTDRRTNRQINKHTSKSVLKDLKLLETPLKTLKISLIQFSDGLTNGPTDGWTDRRTRRQMDRQTDGQINQRTA